MRANPTIMMAINIRARIIVLPPEGYTVRKVFMPRLFLGCRLRHPTSPLQVLRRAALLHRSSSGSESFRARSPKHRSSRLDISHRRLPGPSELSGLNSIKADPPCRFGRKREGRDSTFVVELL